MSEMNEVLDQGTGEPRAAADGAQAPVSWPPRAGVLYLQNNPFRAPETNPQCRIVWVGEMPDSDTTVAIGFVRGGDLDPWGYSAWDERQWHMGRGWVEATGESEAYGE